MTSVSNRPDGSGVLLESLEPPRWPALRLNQLMLLVLASGVAGWVMLGLFRVAGPFAVVLGVLSGATLAVAVTIIAHRGLSMDRDALVWALSIAAQREMPLASALQAFAEQSGLLLRRRIFVLIDALTQGLSLPDALDRAPGVLPRDSELIIRVGWEAGIPAEALAEAAARRSAPPQWVNLTGRLVYLMGVLFLIQSLCGIIMTRISPRLEAIFRDFGLPLPGNTRLMIHAVSLASRYGYITGFFLIAEILLMTALALSLSRGLIDWIPFTDRILHRRHSALVLRSLAPVVENGKPLPPAIATLARRYPRGSIRDRLRGAALDIDRGRDWCESFRRHGLIHSADAALFDAALRAGNLPWALRESAETGERRLAYRLQAWVQVLFPIVVLALGALIFLIATAYFSPMVILIQRLAS